MRRVKKKDKVEKFQVLICDGWCSRRASVRGASASGSRVEWSGAQSACSGHGAEGGLSAGERAQTKREKKEMFDTAAPQRRYFVDDLGHFCAVFDAKDAKTASCRVFFLLLFLSIC
jgi:hypothetical protein